MIVSVLDITRAAKQAGFVYNHGLLISVAISCAENPSHETTAVYTNVDQWRSRDRGLWMLNDHYHSEVSDACAFDLLCSAQEAYRISGQGTKFTAWAVFNSTKYRQYMELARTANDLDEALAAGDVVTKALQSMQIQLDALTVERDAVKNALVNCASKTVLAKTALTEIRDRASNALTEF